ncbi:transcriptional regulator, GntR family [Granulicella pectinivorans]|jgi:DNA-binding GntR family transcriptional regulator|uniref:Transcriptional regulator, GntR family n=1 Tax=Granulicella pectinivorans TaxID=474950 RepID=A0A1I6MFQ1_9BACT|nr:GntR family transcriptional regulator [Granulicella pectinivorans]SFS14534.1 transcriptional regulator, GntR family [Granulicella pectinivorans]
MPSIDPVDDLDTSALNRQIWKSAPRENLTVRVANAIREQVRNGTLKRGAQLRGEIEFAKELGVSRQTLREATRLLTLEGLLAIRHGVGTFVAEAPVALSSPLNSMQSMSGLIRASGGEPSVGELKVRRIAASEEIAAALDIAQGDAVAEVLRVRLIDGKPLAVAYDYLALRNDADWMLPLLRTFDGASIYEFIGSKLNVPLACSEASLTAVAANKRHAELLCVKPGSPLLLVREIHLDSKQKPGLYSTVFHNSSRMSFTLVRPGNQR